MDVTPGARGREAGWTQGGGLGDGDSATLGEGECTPAALVDEQDTPAHAATAASVLAAFSLFQQLRRPQLHLVDAALEERRAHEVAEQGMRPVRPRPELRMELAGHEPRMVRELDDLDETAVWRDAAEDHPGLAEHLAVLVVELEAMAVALVHDLLAVCLVGESARGQLARVQAEAHRAAHLIDVALLGHQVDDRGRGERGELGRVGVGRVQGLAREVDHGALHAEAQAQVRDAVVARIARRDHLALYAAVAEPAGHDDAGDSHQR